MSAADRAEHHRLDKHRDEHRSGVEAKRPERGNLSRPRGDGGVHREDGAENRADAHQPGNAEADVPNQPRQRLRLGGVVFVLSADRDIQLRIRRQPVAKGIERVCATRAARAPTDTCCRGDRRPAAFAHRSRFRFRRRRRRLSKMPTTCHRFCPETTVSPTVRCTNCPLAPRPTITSLVPNWNIRPSTIENSLRSGIPAGSMPRIGTFAGASGDDFFGSSMIT